MLEQTFVHIPGIGAVSEKRFWEAGIHSWNDFMKNYPPRLSRPKRDRMLACLETSRQQAESGNAKYFSDLLPGSLQWRFFPEFRDATVYLDIETTGLDNWGNDITTIAMYDGRTIKYFINGRNLTDFVDEIERYRVLVTYNGKCFDVPFLERYFKIKLRHAHIDLRYVLASLGYKGGLKGCEARLGIDRGELAGIDGFFAVLLWHDYEKNKNHEALETLLAYNVADVLNLEHLMVLAYNLKLRETPFGGCRLPVPSLPENPFSADRETVAKIKRNYTIW